MSYSPGVEENEEQKPDLWFYLILVFVCLLIVSGTLLTLNHFEIISFNQTKEIEVSTETPKEKLTPKNKELAKIALNAIGEIDSVASVGANYPQYTNAIQAAKIKFDVPMREYSPANKEDEEIKRQLYDVFLCYVEAKDAWSEFIKAGDEYGFLSMEDGFITQQLASKYGYKADKGEYFRETVLTTILRKASSNFEALNKRINKNDQ